jgi:hypothetical protein
MQATLQLPHCCAHACCAYAHAYISSALQYVVETEYVGERDVAGAATEIIGNERNVVKEQVKPAAAGGQLSN